MKKGVDEICSPIFTPEMGRRLAHARMKMLMDQTTLARFLGVKQPQISRLERGQIQFLEPPVTLARLEGIFSKFTRYILFGVDSDRFQNPGKIKTDYYKLKLAKKHKGKIL